jgi:hypothetical protein
MLTDVDLKRLVGQELSSVTISTNSIRLQFVRYPLSSAGHFLDSAVVEIEHGYEVRSGSGNTVAIYRDGLIEFRTGAAALLQFIDLAIDDASISGTEDMNLTFRGSGEIRILASDEGFEGFQVHHQSSVR